jgi:putative transposase
MRANQAVFPIAAMARVLGVSEAGYHAWRRRPPSARCASDAALLKRIRTIHAVSRGTYGACRSPTGWSRPASRTGARARGC